MTTTSHGVARRQRYHQNAYQFVFASLRYTQEHLGRPTEAGDEADAHISGVELVEGIREFAREQFGLMARTVLHHWGIRNTEDFGRIVFELVDRGEMRKTDRDTLHDFYDVYDFDEAFGEGYPIDTSRVFSR
jgi:uncharacterized repeat protein (TIGR04138 family)